MRGHGTEMSAAIDERAGNQGADGTGSCAILIRNSPQTLSSIRDHHLESPLRAGPLVRAIKADMVSKICAASEPFVWTEPMRGLDHRRMQRRKSGGQT